MPTRSTALRRVQGSPKPPPAPWGRHNDNRWSKGKSQADSRALNFIASNFALQSVPPSSLHIYTLPGPCLERPEREQGCCKLGPRSWQMRWHSPAALSPPVPVLALPACGKGLGTGLLVVEDWRVISKQGRVSYITSIARTGRQRWACASRQLPQADPGMWDNTAKCLGA